MNSNNFIVKTRVPDEVYTDRQDLINHYYETSLETANRRSMSAVLLGHRRMGKTEVFKRVVNKLFFEQDHNDPKAVIPVYYSFPDTIKDDISFAKEYLSNFFKYYIGFYLNDPDLPEREVSEKEIVEMYNNVHSERPTRTKWVINFFQQIEEFPMPVKKAFELPRKISDSDDTSIVMFLDEFQNTRLPKYDFNVSGYYHEAADSITCPHFVTGSAMSILSTEIISRGSLFGRFEYDYIEGMTLYYGTLLVYKLTDYYKAEVGELMGLAISERCGGNPFYITAVIKQAAKSKTAILNLEILDDILAVDISSGFIWGELCDQVNRWINRINDFQITKWILYLASMDENKEPRRGEIIVERVQKMLKERDNIDVEIRQIRDIMILLARGDLLDYSGGASFYHIKDPILNDFLKVWGRIELDKVDRTKVRNDLRTKYYKFSKRSLDEYKGYLGEVHMSQVLLASQRTILSGNFFHSKEDVKIPTFSFVRHRYRLSSGRGREIDLIGAAGPESWVCQSKWLESSKAGIDVLKELMAQSQAVEEDFESVFMKKWIFAHNGLTKDAEEFAKDNEIFWSTRQELDNLLNHLNLRALYSFKNLK